MERKNVIYIKKEKLKSLEYRLLVMAEELMNQEYKMKRELKSAQ